MVVLIDDRQTAVALPIPRLRGIVRKILKELDCSDREISILFVDDPQIRDINKTYLQRDRPTNVIAFPMALGDHGNVNPQVLGDVVISAETALSDAGRAGIDLEDEITFLLIHGVLHLLGYDHEGPAAQARRMRSKEREIFFTLRHFHMA